VAIQKLDGVSDRRFPDFWRLSVPYVFGLS
jgi:hypothetical protein